MICTLFHTQFILVSSLVQKPIGTDACWISFVQQWLKNQKRSPKSDLYMQIWNLSTAFWGVAVCFHFQSMDQNFTVDWVVFWFENAGEHRCVLWVCIAFSMHFDSSHQKQGFGPSRFLFVPLRAFEFCEEAVGLWWFLQGEEYYWLLPVSNKLFVVFCWLPLW